MDVLVLGVMDRIMDRDIRERCGNRAYLLKRVNQSTLSWFGHKERMDEQRLTKRICRTEVGEVK